MQIYQQAFYFTLSSVGTTAKQRPTGNAKAILDVTVPDVEAAGDSQRPGTRINCNMTSSIFSAWMSWISRFARSIRPVGWV